MMSTQISWYLRLHFSFSFVWAGNEVFDPSEDADPQGKILAMLLQKSLIPVEKNDPLGEL